MLPRTASAAQLHQPHCARAPGLVGCAPAVVKDRRRGRRSPRAAGLDVLPSDDGLATAKTPVRWPAIDGLASSGAPEGWLETARDGGEPTDIEHRAPSRPGTKREHRDEGHQHQGCCRGQRAGRRAPSLQTR